MVKISVIMPVYNSVEFLRRSIESVSKQTLKDLELICIDDGSTDDSLELLYDLKKNYSFINIISQKNQGPGPARNKGIENANGEYIAFLDADDEFFDENALQVMYESNVDNVEMISANLEMINSEGIVVENFLSKYDNYMNFSRKEIIKPESYGAPLSFYKNIFKRDFIIQNNIIFPDLKRGEDPVFLAKILILINKVQVVPVSLYGHHFEIGGGNEAKINTYEIKRDYLQHFYETSQILANGGLNNISEFYKIHMFRYLTNGFNNQDYDLFELFNDIYGIENNSFDESDFNYIRFIVPAMFYFISQFDTEEFFLKVNRKFLGINIYDTFAIDENVIDNYFLVIYSYSLDDFKVNHNKYLMNNIKFKKELNEFKIKKFIFNVDISDSPIVFENTKKILYKYPIWKNKTFSKKLIRKCYGVLLYDSMYEYKLNIH